MSIKPSYEPQLQGHLPALDGVRGIAILLVMIFHTTIVRATAPIDDYYYMFGRSAWLGVDLFFVLSGFLITGILFDTKGSKRFFRSFYLRRTVRIFPLYYLVVAFCIFLGPHLPFFGGRGAPNPRPDQWWYWLYASNFLAARDGFKHIMLGPTWSLAIEEQFYLVWPLLIFFLSRRAMMGLCIAFIALSFGLRFVLFFNGVGATALYVMTPTRLDPIAVGSFIALAARGPGGIRALVPWAYAAALPTGVFVSYYLCMGYINKNLPYMILYGYVATALFFGALFVLVLAIRPTSTVHKLCTSKLLMILGKYSYALYLFNRPVGGIVHRHLFDYREFHRLWGSSIPGQVVYSLIVIGCSFALALLSWHLFEKHFLKLKKFFPSEKELLPNTTLQREEAQPCERRFNWRWLRCLQQKRQESS